MVLINMDNIVIDSSDGTVIMKIQVMDTVKEKKWYMNQNFSII